MTSTGYSNNNNDLVVVKDLIKYFPVRGGVFRRIVNWVQAVDGVSFAIREGETLGLVGESGCGKSTIGRTILHLLEPTSGSVLFEGQNVFELQKQEMMKLRRDMQIIFQDPYSSLNPRRPISDSIKAGFNIHQIGTQSERDEMVMDILQKVGLGDTVVLIVFGTDEQQTAVAVKYLAQNWKELYHEFNAKDFGLALQVSTEGTSEVKVLERLPAGR